MRVAGVQTDLAWEDGPANRRHLTDRIREAANDGADLVVLPEMFPSGFSMHTVVTAEPVDGPSVTWLCGLAAELGVAITGSIPTDAGGAMPVNRMVLAAADGNLAAHYDKLHPFGYGEETDHFAAGDRLVTVTLGGMRWGLFVCYDLRFANAFWQTAREVDGYLVVANWPEPRRHHWRSLLVARAIENQAWVVGVNRIGSGGGLDYAGDSLIVDPLGAIVADAEDRATTITADVDPAITAEVRTDLPFLPDRRDL